MKSKPETLTKLKTEIHQLIDNIDEEVALLTLKHDIITYSSDDVFDEDLTDEQLKGLKDALAAADRGETVSDEEYKKAMARWLK